MQAEPPVAPIAASAAGAALSTDGADGALDFVSLLQAQMGLASGRGAPVAAAGSADATAQGSEPGGNYRAIARLPAAGEGAEGAAPVGEPAGTPGPGGGGAGEYRGLLAALEGEGQQTAGPAAGEGDKEGFGSPAFTPALGAASSFPLGDVGDSEEEGEEEGEEDGEGYFDDYEQSYEGEEMEEGEEVEEGGEEEEDYYVGEEEEGEEGEEGEEEEEELADFDNHFDQHDVGMLAGGAGRASSSSAAAAAAASSPYTGAPPPPRPPPSHAAPSAGVPPLAAGGPAGGSPPLTPELLQRLRCLDPRGRVRVSLRLERQRPAGLRPLWLRLEWNLISMEALRAALAEAERSRGLTSDIPRVEPTGKGSAPPGLRSGSGPGSGPHSPGAHDLALVLPRGGPGASAAVRLPWVACQRQAPAEADVLRAVKGFYGSGMLPAPPPAPAPAAVGDGDGAGESEGGGPLLLFPDTSALVSMLGGNMALNSAAAGGGGRPALDWSLLLQLARAGRFGRALPLRDQVFIVVSDSVMKQLDGLKNNPETHYAVRRFMGEGLEQAGPAGYDFLTVLGAHEGEGLALGGAAASAGAGPEGLAGSRSPWLSSRGQAVDLRIVEVALMFQREVDRAHQAAGGAGPEAAAAAGSFSPGGAGSGGRSFLPVVLLSNDNAQIAAAKSHGLPAFRLSSAASLSVELTALAEGGGVLTSGVLRRLLGPQATVGLGTTATKSLQDHFDGAVATLRALLGVLGGGGAGGLVGQLERAARRAAEAAEAAGGSAGGGGGALQALQEIRELLGSAGGEAAGDGGAGSSSGCSDSGSGGVLGALRSLEAGLRAELVEWEGALRSHTAPSRLLRWAALAGAGPGP
ncbi:hypothetical protein GPECTOR_274g718 [Gonium pectorale]|uniref:PIN domain-containing protein n=1 Tax=Gonium pectorale TaxID=33097 RepID=A0A150FW36_GONPE|nr:hypothetical protein GPECTOR_274g718 [Gonium pectorale]|eukprot:KXZ41816.1 hypothetical protein GPECTOR_274g718 [Gonium pectorale]